MTLEDAGSGQEAAEGPGGQHRRRERRTHRWDSRERTTWHHCTMRLRGTQISLAQSRRVTSQQGTLSWME